MRLDLPRSPQSALLLARLGLEQGLPVEAVLADTGLELDALGDPEAEVSAQQELAVVANLVEAFGERSGLGMLAGERYHLTAYGLWSFMVISSPTVGEAVEVALRYLDLTFSHCDISARTSDADLELVLEPDTAVPTRLQPFVVEREAAAIRTIQRESSLDMTPLLGVRFAFPAPEGADPGPEIFGVSPEYDAADNVLVFDGSGLDQPMPQADEHTAARVQAECRLLLERRRARSGTAGRVRELLLAGIVTRAEPPVSDEVASALHLSGRTLQRRLAEEGTSFRALLDEVREHLAEELLVSGAMSVADVARRLGYVEVSSFSQAFRRWKGVAPRIFAGTRR